MNCLVTGASGFIGRELCAVLAAHGDSFSALSKSSQTLPCGTSTRALDLALTDFEDDFFQDVDVVYHLAAIAHQHAAEDAYELVNHQATLRLARAASSSGVGHFIFLSSVKAMGPTSAAKMRSEFDTSPAADAYGRSKWQAEEALRHEFADSAMMITILRPALVYAAEVKGNLDLLARGVNLGLPRPPQEGGRSMVALQDLTQLLHGLAQRNGPQLKTWIVADGEHYSTRRIYDALRRAAGKPVGTAWWPHWLWRVATSCLDIGRGSPESSWEKLFSSELYSSVSLQRETGWRPQLQLEDVLVPKVQAP